MQADAQASAGERDPVEELIRQGAHREAAALAARLHAVKVGHLCMALLGSQAEAEEALQDTWLAAYRAMASYRGEGSVRAWLYGIARRMCARRLEARLRSERPLRLVPDCADGAELPEAQVAAGQRAARVRAALERLTPTEREAVLLRYEADLSFREVGAACGVDEATARKRASRGLERLRGLFGREEEP